MRRTSRVLAAAAVLGLMLGFSPQAEAATITGGITFGGVWAPTGGSSADPVGTATGVNVLGDAANVTCASLPPTIGSCTGSYAALNGNNIVAAYNDFQFSPLVAPSPLWSFTFNGLTYSFNLATVTITSQTSTGIVLNGTGTLFITGFTPTAGSWSFSGDTTGSVFAFSATNTATGVPEPASVLLLGLGLLAGGRAVRRRFSN